jgi:hypothetical protein
MSAVRMMQVTIDEIIDVVAVWDGGMSAVGTMDVAGRVAAATVRRRAGGRMGVVDRQFVLFDGAVGAGMMQVTLVQVVEVSLVFDRGMPAIGTVLVHGSGGLLGLGTFLAVALHKPLDSMAITSVMAAGGWSPATQKIVNALFSLLCPIGALFFVLEVREFSGQQATIVGCALAVSAGVFICIALSDLLPEVEFHSHNRVRLSLALVAGIALAWGIRFLEPVHAHSHGRHATEVLEMK